MKNHFDVLILGGGTAGCAVAARLAKEIPSKSIGIVEPAETHYYQPLWTLVGAGVEKKEKTARPMERVIPENASWAQDTVQKIFPNEKKVLLESERVLTFNFLVIATGLELNWESIKGVDGNLGKNGLCSIYGYEEAAKTAQMLNAFKGGRALFIMPPIPIKCAGAPQKIMYLAEELFSKNGVRAGTEIVFAVAGGVIFGVPKFAEALLKIVKKKNINIRFMHKLVEVKVNEKIAVFEKTTKTESGVVTEIVNMDYDLLHVVPPMRAHSYIMQSKLAFESGPHEGWLKVDQGTLQHVDYKNIFGIGDVTGIPNSKTGAAIRKQAPVVVQNLLDVMEHKSPSLFYDGYSSCPLITGFGKVILAEFGYNGALMPSFPMDMSKERKSMWILKRYLLPILYWKGMMRGLF